jgi:hypothetical protein
MVIGWFVPAKDALRRSRGVRRLDQSEHYPPNSRSTSGRVFLSVDSSQESWSRVRRMTDPVPQYRQRRPDVDAFLVTERGLAPQEVAAVLRLDQGERWRNGERNPAENYFTRHPEVHPDLDAAIDLIFHEFLLLENHGQAGDLERFVNRFPSMPASFAASSSSTSRSRPTTASMTAGTVP